MGDIKQPHLICDTPLIPPAAAVSSEVRRPQQIPWRAVLAAAFVKLALGILIGMYYPQGVLESSDSLEYHQLAINLAEHQVFSQSPEVPV